MLVLYWYTGISVFGKSYSKLFLTYYFMGTLKYTNLGISPNYRAVTHIFKESLYFNLIQ